MRYIIVMPDYTGSCLRDEFDGELPIQSLDLSENLVQEIESWHALYRKIIPLESEERKRNKKQIEKLDKDGIQIAQKIKKQVPGGVKIKYFSEGKLKYLDFD